MSDDRPEGEVSAELRELGRNLLAAAKTAWQSEESRRLQQELRTGLSELEASLREASNDFSSSEAGQRFKSEAHEFGQRVHSGQVEAELRSELLAALRTVNTELKKASRPSGDRA